MVHLVHVCSTRGGRWLETRATCRVNGVVAAGVARRSGVGHEAAGHTVRGVQEAPEPRLLPVKGAIECAVCFELSALES